MSREIKFRGLRADGGGWVYGGVVYGKSGNVYIFQGNDTETVEDDCLEVNKETVGQFIGIKDKNGTKIYEGDVFKNINDHGDYIDNTYVITFESGKFGFFNHGFFDHDIETENIEIIGNIHEK